MTLTWKWSVDSDKIVSGAVPDLIITPPGSVCPVDYWPLDENNILTNTGEGRNCVNPLSANGDASTAKSMTGRIPFICTGILFDLTLLCPAFDTPIWPPPGRGIRVLMWNGVNSVYVTTNNNPYIQEVYPCAMIQNGWYIFEWYLTHDEVPTYSVRWEIRNAVTGELVISATNELFGIVSDYKWGICLYGSPIIGPYSFDITEV